ncbi:MAG: hypothetical protein HRT73_07455 [Flavobacteriales bacterium]|nr:hypothetical protein [Flavobacteriales bacterium]
MAEYVGYTALLISLLSVNMNNMLRFRWLHLLASCIYFIYGFLIDAMPLVIGATLFAIIHSYRLYKIYKVNA